MNDLQARAEVRLDPLLSDDAPPASPKHFEADQSLKLAVVELKRMMFQQLRDTLEGRTPAYDLSKLMPAVAATHEPAQIHANGLHSAPSPDIAPERSNSWDRLLLISFSQKLKRGHSFMPPAEITDTDERQHWISAKLNEAWPDKPPFVDTMQAMTRGAAVVRHNKNTRPLIPHHLLESYKAMDATARDDFLREWFSWSKYGDGFTAVANGTELPERFLPTDDASLTLTEGNKQFRAAIVFDVSPLCIDLDLNLVNYLVRVGLPWEGDMGDPTTWAPETRESLWASLFGSFDALAAYYRGETPRLPATITRAPGEVLLPVRPADPKAARKWAAAKPRIVPPAENAEAAQSTTVATSDNKRLFPAAFGVVSVDRDVQAILRGTGRLNLPRQWSRIPRWEKLKADELARLIAMGPAAYEDTDDEPALLEKEPSPGVPQKDWPTRLTAYAERALSERWGGTGFLRSETIDGVQYESLCKSTPLVIDKNPALLQVEMSWHGKAGPLIATWREDHKHELEAARREIEAVRFPLLEAMGDVRDKNRIADIDARIRQLTSYEKAQWFMEIILYQAMKQRSDVVEIHSLVFITALWPDRAPPKNWKREVERIIETLMDLRITVRVGGKKDVGNFLFRYKTDDDESPFMYFPRGEGGHGAGIFQVRINDAFLGCFRMFLDDTARRRTRFRGIGGRQLDFTRRLSKEQKEGLRYVSVDAGTVHYSRFAQFTRQQHNLSTFIGGNITKKCDGIAGGKKGPRKSDKVRETDQDGALDREYDTTFCPLLPVGQRFVAALGHFSDSYAERGFTLYGTARPARDDGKAGALPGGIIEKMGYAVPSGNAHDRRNDILDNVIVDLRRVVVDEYGGIVVGKLDEKDRKDGSKGALWLPLDDWRELDDKTLGHRLKVYMFLPPDWTAKRKTSFEDRSGYLVTESPEAAEAAAWGEPAAQPLAPGERCTADTGWRGLSLPQRLHAAMKHRGLNQTEVATIFGVTQGAVSRWLAAARGETDTGKAVRIIPEDMARLLVRWIETGEAPTKAELEARPSIGRRPSRGRVL